MSKEIDEARERYIKKEVIRLIFKDTILECLMVNLNANRKDIQEIAECFEGIKPFRYALENKKGVLIIHIKNPIQFKMEVKIV